MRGSKTWEVSLLPLARGLVMPVIHFNLIDNRTVEQKRELAKRVSETVCDVLQVKPESVRIAIHEVTPNDFSVGGVTLAEKLEQNQLQEKADVEN